MKTKKLYRYPNHSVQRFVVKYPELKKISKQPQAVWINSWDKVARSLVGSVLEKARELEQTPIFVVYFIPDRDSGNYSRGGLPDYRSYKNAIKYFFSLIDIETIVIFEPDAIPLDFNLVKRDVFTEILKELSNQSIQLYLDVGHPNWHPVDDVVSMLSDLDLKRVRGISLNVSNFVDSQKCIEYGNDICRRLSTAEKSYYFVIDSGRNGNGAPRDNEWCNPKGRKIGHQPEFIYDDYFDGYLWIKPPGESDGQCNGGPKAGEFWVEYALGLLE